MSTATPSTIAPSPAAGAVGGPERERFALVQQRLLDHYGVRARSRFLDLERPAIRAHVLEAGAGEPLLMLHGGDGQAVDWAPLMAELQEEFHVIGLDRPGFGLTDPFDYREVDLRRHAADVVTSALDALGLPSATIAGGSMGGFFALAAALEHPERVCALALLGMPAGIARQAPLPLRVVCGVPGMSRLFMAGLRRPTTEPRKRQYVKMFGVDVERVPELYFEMQVAGLAMPGARTTWATLLPRLAGLRGMRPEVLLLDELPRLDMPVAIVWGERDMAPAGEGREAARRIPRGTFTEIPGIGHFPFLEAPAACAEIVRALASDGAHER